MNSDRQAASQTHNRLHRLGAGRQRLRHVEELVDEPINALLSLQFDSGGSERPTSSNSSNKTNLLGLCRALERGRASRLCLITVALLNGGGGDGLAVEVQELHDIGREAFVLALVPQQLLALRLRRCEKFD